MPTIKYHNYDKCILLMQSVNHAKFARNKNSFYLFFRDKPVRFYCFLHASINTCRLTINRVEVSIDYKSDKHYILWFLKGQLRCHIK